MRGSHQHCKAPCGLLAAALLFVILICPAGCSRQQDGVADQASAQTDFDEPTATPDNGFLGLTFDSIDSTPLVVKAPVAGSPAEEAGIIAGDELVALENTVDPSMLDIFKRLSSTRPGEQIEVVLRRDSIERKYDLQLMSFDEVQGSMEGQSEALAD